MKFTEENANAILAEINKKCSPYECPMCKQRTNFIFGKGESQILSFQREGMQLKADNGINFIPLIHQRFGYPHSVSGESLQPTPHCSCWC